MHRPLQKSDLSDISTWWSGFTSSELFMDPPGDNWFEWVSLRNNAFAFCNVGPKGRISVFSQFDIEVEGDIRVAWLAIMTAPALHGRGWASFHWKELQKKMFALNINLVKASIDKQNEKSKRFFTKLGFKLAASQPDDPQLELYELMLKTEK